MWETEVQFLRQGPSHWHVATTADNKGKAKQVKNYFKTYAAVAGLVVVIQVISVLLGLAFILGLGYVAIHFIGKYW